MAQQVGQEVPPRLEHIQHMQAHYVVQVPVLLLCEMCVALFYLMVLHKNTIIFM